MVISELNQFTSKSFLLYYLIRIEYLLSLNLVEIGKLCNLLWIYEWIPFSTQLNLAKIIINIAKTIFMATIHNIVISVILSGKHPRSLLRIQSAIELCLSSVSLNSPSLVSLSKVHYFISYFWHILVVLQVGLFFSCNCFNQFRYPLFAVLIARFNSILAMDGRKFKWRF